MKNPFKAGDRKVYEKTVEKHEVASFESGTVHEVYATFALARDAEWSGRLFVLDMKEEGEEGIGTSLTIEHISPAFPGDRIRFEAVFEEISESREILNSFEAYSGHRLIARGRQGQKILPREKIDRLFRELRKPG